MRAREDGYLLVLHVDPPERVTEPRGEGIDFLRERLSRGGASGEEQEREKSSQHQANVSSSKWERSRFARAAARISGLVVRAWIWRTSA